MLFSENLYQMGKICQIFKRVSQQFSEKEIGNLRDLLPTFVNLSQRFLESPSRFGTKHLKTLKWSPKLEGVTGK